VGKHYTPAHPTAMGRMKPETKAKDISIFSLVQQAHRLIVFPPCYLLLSHRHHSNFHPFVRSSVHLFFFFFSYKATNLPTSQPTISSNFNCNSLSTLQFPPLPPLFQVLSELKGNIPSDAIVLSLNWF